MKNQKPSRQTESANRGSLHAVVGRRFVSPFGYTHPNDDKRQMCPYCYNEDTQRITDFVDLQPYQEHHKGKPFKAYSCYCCGGKWHWSETPNVLHEP